MNTINQSVRGARQSKVKKTKSSALKKGYNSQKKKYYSIDCPQRSGICEKIGVLSPKKPNSAKRPIVRVRLKNKEVITAYIPGERHNLQEYSSVLISGRGAKDLPGVKYRVIRGVLDAEGVKDRKQGRSIYGTKKLKGK